MKYKNLKSVAYCFGHSYMSLMNYDFGDYINERFFQIAKRTGKTEINIDLLNENIEPNEFNTKIILGNIKQRKLYFPKDLESQNCSIEHIKEVKIRIIFDLNKTKISEHSGLELPSYKCYVEILDDRNRLHKATIPEWWNY